VLVGARDDEAIQREFAQVRAQRCGALGAFGGVGGFGEVLEHGRASVARQRNVASDPGKTCVLGRGSRDLKTKIGLMRLSRASLSQNNQR
jgi:hypothetical protein